VIDLSIAGYIDHTLLKVDANQADIERLCQEAVQYQTYSVCINPGWIATARSALTGSAVKICTVVGFPLGATFESAVLKETELAISSGAQEIDMVMNVGAVKSGDYRHALHGMRMVSDMVHGANGVTVKVIVESAVLTDEEKRTVAALVVESGADYLKTSTGFVPNPNLLRDVQLFIQTLPKGFPVKASGGIRDYLTAKTLLDMGVSRIGTSSTAKIIAEAMQQS
jgi:deoxyribose-phosphate aldolase